MIKLRDLLAPDAIGLHLASTAKEDLLLEVIQLLHLDDEATQALFKIAKRRENLGSTGVGRGVAIPHCRSPVMDRLRLAFGRSVAGVDFHAIDDQPVHFIFLIAAPPVEVSNQYLPVLARIAQFAKEPDVPERMAKVGTVEEFLALLEEKGA